MSSKRSFHQIQQHQQQQEEPWLRYPSSLNMTKDFSRSGGGASSTPSFGSSVRQKHFSMGSFGDFQLRSITPSSAPPPPPPPQQQQQQQQQQQPSQQPSSTTFIPEIKHRRSLARLSAPSASLQYGVGSDSYGYSSYRSSRSRRGGPPPKPLSEELSMALQNSEDTSSTPDTPSGLLSSPADISTPSSAASSSSTSTTHFPLFKPSAPSSQSTGKLRPSPLSLYNNPHQNETNSPSSFPLKSDSPTSAVSRDSTAATDIATSPRAAAAAAAAAATLGFASPMAPRSTLPLHSGPLVSMSSATSTSGSSYGSNNSSPTAITAPCSSLCQPKSGLVSNQHQQLSNCLHKQSTASQQIHHPACQHHTNFPEDDLMAHGPKLGRVTKNVRRFGFPQFRPQLDESDPGTFDPSRRDKSAGMTMKTTSTTTGYGMRRGHHHEDDDDDLGVYALEPPKKRQRSTATMLLDAAFETVIFTGAVALSAYQLITGKGKVPEQSSITSGDDDGLQAENIKTLEDDPMEEKLSLDLESETFTNANINITNAPPRSIRPLSYSGTLLTRTPSTSVSSRPTSFHHKAQQKRASFRQSRQSFSGSSPSTAYSHIPHQHTGHFRTVSMPVRPNTGTEDTDEAFLRMEAQLNSLIAEGKRALSSRIEVWDEE